MPSRKRKSESHEPKQEHQTQPSREREQGQHSQELKNVPGNQTPNTPEKKESEEE